MKILLIVAAIIVVAAVATQFVLSGMFRAKVNELRRQLLASQVSVAPPDQSLIPILVREFAARNGGRMGGPTAVNMIQSAEMRLRSDQAFFHINATQISGTRAPGFVWHAAGTMAAVVPLQIVDSYVADIGRLEVRIAGSIAVASVLGPGIDRGEAMRFLAELAWNPDALINSTGLIWRQVDDLTVEVSMETRGGPARVSLLFDTGGDIIGIDANDRPRAVGNADVPTRWVGRFTDYAQSGDYRWPRHGEIAWMLPEGEFIYWRGDILSVSRAGI